MVEPAPRAKPFSFTSLDGKTVAVVLRPHGERGKQFVFLGTAAFQRDDALGNVLIISAADPQSADTKLIFSEEQWKGRIIPDFEYGCDLCMIPQSA